MIDCFTEDAGREDHRTEIDMTISYTKAAVGSLLLVGRSLPAFADPLDTESFHHGHMWGAGWGFMGAGFMLLFWVLAILAIVWVSVRAKTPLISTEQDQLYGAEPVSVG